MTDSVNYRIYWKPEEEERRWIDIPDTESARNLAIQQGAMFFTALALSEPYKGNGQPEPNRRGDFVLDFDDAANPERAYCDSKSLLIDHLPREYDTDPYTFLYWLSGSKGLHGSIPAKLFGAEKGDPYLHLIYGRIAAYWCERFKIDTLDLSMYAGKRGKMFRIPNVRRRNGRYKVPVTMDEMRDMPWGELLELSKSPREIEEPDVDLEANQDLAKLYQEMRAKVYAEQEAQKQAPKLSPEEIERLSSSIPPCITHIIQQMPAKSDHVNFNKLVMVLVNYFQAAGYSKDAAWSKAEPFVERYPSSDTYDTVDKRVRHWWTEWNYLAANDTYTFNCSFVLGLHLPGSAFDCKHCRGEQQDAVGDDEEITLREWPKLDPAALHGICGRFVELATRSSEADPAAVLVTFLVRAGIEFGSKPHLMVGDSRHAARVNAVVVGNSSKSRKGTSGKPVTKVFAFNGQEASITDLNYYIPARHSPGPLSSGEGLIYAVRDEARQWQVDKKTKQGEWVVVDPGVEDKRLFILDEELAGALHSTKREGNTLSVIVRNAYDDGNIEPLTKRDRIRATGAHIGIVTHVTVAELKTLLDTTQALNGFANRFLWVCARRQKLVPMPKPMPETEFRIIEAELLRTVQSGSRLARIEFTNEAAQLWSDHYPELSAEHEGLAGAIINRAETMVLRLSLIYALLDLSQQIRPDHLQAALAMWQYCQDSALYIFGEREANPTAQRILDELEKGPMSLTDVHRLFSNNVTKRQIKDAIQELIAAGKIEIRDEPTNGRPKKIISLTKKTKETKKGPSEDDTLNSFNSFNSSSAAKNADFDDAEVF